LAKILHVEDDRDDQHIFGSILKAGGHTVVAVEKISHAIEVLSGSRFDLVICDGTLEQEEDGLRWAEQIRREGRKVVVLTNFARSEIVTCLLKIDAQFKTGYLQAEVEKALAA